MSDIFTIGYSGMSWEHFISILHAQQIDRLIDVREIPLSRKRGFSKTAMSQGLSKIGIDYVHARNLGSPKHLRHRVRADGDFATFFRSLRVTYRTPNVLNLLEQISIAASAKRQCLMCCCEEWEWCHRRILSERLEQRFHLRVIHLPELRTAVHRVAA
jgi:uncharacterized protein (DUF488 family)